MRNSVSSVGHRVSRGFIITLAGLSLLCGCNQASIAAHQPDIWQKDYDAALKQAAAENKYVLVSISGLEWCGWCKRLEKEVFSQPEFVEYAQKNLICVLLNFDSSGRATNAEFARQHDMLLEKFQVQGFPTVLMFNPHGRMMKRTGYQRGGAVGYIELVQSVMAADLAK